MSGPAFRILWTGCEVLLDVAWLTAAGLSAVALHAAWVGRPAPLDVYLGWWPWYLGVHLILFACCGLYREDKDLLNVRELRALLIALSLGSLAAVAAPFAWREPGQHGLWRHVPWLADWHRALRPAADPERLSRFAVLATLPLAWLYGSTARLASFRGLRALARRRPLGRPTLILGALDAARRLRRRCLRAPTVGQRVVGVCVPEGASADGGADVLGSYGDASDLVVRHRIERLLVAGDPRQDPALLALVTSLAGRVPCRIELEPLAGHRFTRGPLGTLRMEPLRRDPSFVGRGAKRAFDVAVASVLLLVTAPLHLLLAALVALTSGRPVWVRQERSGARGRTFGLWKLRTMYGSVSSQASKPHRADPRVTRVGRFLRRTSLDELPQLWNVLRGDMSLVGPRPELVEVTRAYDERTRQRLSVRPGLTGLWQISPARRRPIHEGLDYDLYYLAHRDLFLDATILLLTPFAVLRGIGAR